MKLAKKIFMLCVMTAMICVPASAEDVTIDMSLLMFGSANLTVNVDGELSNALSGTYTPYDVVTVQAPNVAGKNFNYWTNVDGKIISYSAALTLTIYSNTVLNAVYGTETVTAQPAAEFLSVTRSGNQIMFNVMATAESDITEYGIRYSTTKNSIDGLKGDDGVTAEKAGSSATNWLFNVTANDDTTCYAVAYVTSGGETYYSDVKAVTLSELDDGVVTIAMLIDLLLGERLDNISEKVITNLQANLCAVTYDANGGSGTMSPQGFVKNTASALTANTFTRSYYTFTGWNTKADGTGTSYQDGASVSLTENTTLYAQWRPLQYAISYALNGGTLSTSNPISYNAESADITLNNPTKTGYTFAGWTGTGITGTSTDVTIPTGSTGNREYTATWTAVEYTISYTLNNGSMSGNPDKYTIESEAITLTNPTKDGYQFAGWTGTYLSGKTQTVTIPTGSTGDRSYTANFSPIVYTISYALNGGTVSSANPASYTIESGDFTLNNPTKTGYTFEGWTGSGLTGATKTVTIAGHSTGNRSYTANWTLIQYDISFDLGGGVFVEGNPTSYNYETETFKLNTPTREGYEFVGWSVEGVEGLSMDITIPQGSTENRQYTANWKAVEYSLSYELNGGTVSPDNPAKYTIESKDFRLTNPIKNGYTFDGWTGTSVDVTESKDVTILKGSTGNREYTANWTLNVYVLSYDLDGGMVSPDNPTSYTVESADIKLTRPTKQGYEFAGWSFDAEISLDVTLPKGTTGDRKYQATWKISTYTISYDLQGGNVTTTNPTSYKVTTEMFKLTNPTRTGYTFVGWTGTGITGASRDVTIPTGSTGNREYTATWTAVEYTISYTLNNGSVSGNPDKYTIESEAITLNNPTKDGYQFDGWTGTELSAKTQTVTILTGTTGDRSYTANFSPIVYTISYALNGGRLSGVNPASYTIESVDITLNNPTKTGYTFEGWTGTGLTGAAKAVTIAGHSTGNRSYTANWTLIQYDISFDLGGGVFVEGNPTSYNYETETFKLNTPTREGYEFVGWSVEGVEGLSMDITIPQGSTENRQYTANWKAREYSLSYELNGGTVSLDNPAKYTIESEDITLTNPTKDGYEFTGWSGTSVDITMSKDVIIPTGSTGNREYVANWTGNVLPESPDVLRSMSVEISGDETLTTNAGTSASITFTANVKGTYSRGQTRVLILDSYVLTWTMGNVEGISFTDGTLTVNESAMAGTHEVEITATAVSGDIRGTDTKTVTVTVIEVAPVQTAPVLTCATPSITVKKGGTIASLTVRADVTSLEWLRSGELPEGLTYRTDGNKFVISGTVSSNAEARDYVYTVLARNEAGTSDAMMITITVSGTGSGTPSAVQVPAEEISNMTDEEIAETIGSKTEVELTGNVENLSETIGRLETLTDVKTLDLSQVTGVSELKLEQTTLESITLEGNQSIKKVEITGNETLTTLNLAGSKVETVDAEGCEKLTSINLEGAENLTSLNVKKTNITTLNVKDCAKLEMVDAKGCENLEEVNLEGCESLEYLDVSETAVTELNVQDCVKLGTIYCASCDLSDINLEGCNNLNDLDCSNNKLLFLDASKLRNLGSLKCSHQRAVKPLARLMNFLDLLLGRGRFAVSAAQEDSTYLENVKNLKAYDEAGNELTVKLDSESGEVEFSGEPAKIAYDYATGFNGVMMDVEVYPSEKQQEKHSSTELGASGGGCTFGFGIGALGILVLMLNLPRKKAE